LDTDSLNLFFIFSIALFLLLAYQKKDSRHAYLFVALAMLFSSSVLLVVCPSGVFCFAVSWVFAFGAAKQKALLCRIDGAFVFVGFNLFYGRLSFRYGHPGQALFLLWHSYLSCGKQEA
jgi:hypothetical protein